ncbi:protein HEATR9 isoform X5 [Callorhinus ursinus]|uniref:Protein HEATR9 isoform X3 n=1 Tax=Callorhinus ursinus TaxID=34884 RepID=A0A3Q7MJN1_CALUR|nr:protein HEATR9 isoform X3 [Callorhinus ursinus]
MAYEKSTDIFDISRSMFKYPWLEYPERTKELRKVTAPVHLPLSCYQMPKEEFPPSPECWRQHPSKPHSVPYCYFKKPEIYTHWHTLYDQRQERDAQKMLWKMRDHPRQLKEGTPIQKFHLPMSKLTIKSRMASKPSDPTGNPLKWQRLKELTKSLESPREHEQFYAAQALGCLGVSDKFVIEALRQVVSLGLHGAHERRKRGLRPKPVQRKSSMRPVEAWPCWRTQVGDEEKLVPVLQMLIHKSSDEAAVEAALCLGFLRPCSNTAQEFLLQCLSQGSKAQQMKALRMLVKMMHVHTATVTRAILDQLCYSSVLEHRFEATQMLKAIGLEKIQAQELEGFTFDLLWRKTYNEPFLAMRQAVAETVEELKMKPTMMNLLEAQLMNSNATARQEAVISLGVLGIRNPQVFHLLLDMLDTEKNQAVKKSLQETLTLLASTDPWIQNKLKNKVLFVYEALKTNEEEGPTRFRKEPENPEELTIQDFQLAQLNPLFIAKSRATSDQQKKLNAQRDSAFYLTSSFPPCFSKPKHKEPATGPWVPRIRKQLQILAKTSQ